VQLSDHHISIIVLAAGLGTRMAAAGKSKLLLPMADGQPILRHAVQGALALGPEELVVVVRPDIPAIQEALSGLPVRCVPNPRFVEGMVTSLAVGAQSLGEGTRAVFVMLGDEPVVPAEIIRAVVGAYLDEGKAITTPVYGSQPGPPTLFARSLFAQMSTLEGDSGGRQLIARHSDMVCRVSLPEEARPRDIDTPEDYRSLGSE